MAYYQLYHNRVTCEIKITPLKKAFQNQPRILEALEKAGPSDVLYHNLNYEFANNRKVLRERANVIKVTWLKQVEDEAELIRNIKF